MLLDIRLPVRNEVCKGPAEHYGIAYYGHNNDRNSRIQFSLGTSAVNDPSEAIANADKELSNLEISNLRGQKLYAAGVHVGRLCLKHNEPQIEVVLNAIAKTKEESQQIFKAPHSSIDNNGIAYVKVVPPASRRWPSSELIKALYLPQENYGDLTQVHGAVTSNRGGHSNGVLVAVTGIEQVVQVAPQPNLHADWY